MVRVDLYPTHFTVADTETPQHYGGDLAGVLHAVGAGRIPGQVSALLASTNEGDFSNGNVLVTVTDHRYLTNSGEGGVVVASNAGGNGGGGEAGENQNQSKNTNTNVNTNNNQVKNNVDIERKVELRPSSSSLWEDVVSLALAHARSTGAGAAGTTTNSGNGNEMLEMEAMILGAMNPAKDVEQLMRRPPVANALLAYNSTKYRTPQRRSHTWAAQIDAATKKRESNQMLLMLDPRSKTEFHPKFGLLGFVQDWKRKRSRLDSLPLRSVQDILDPNSRAQVQPQQIEGSQAEDQQERPGEATDELLLSACGMSLASSTLVRTVTFVKNYTYQKVSLGALINIYRGENDSYSCILRWGHPDNTSQPLKTNSGSMIKGKILSFNIGNYDAAQIFLEQFKSHFELCGFKTVEDSKDKYSIIHVPNRQAIIEEELYEQKLQKHQEYLALQRRQQIALQQEKQQRNPNLYPQQLQQQQNPQHSSYLQVQRNKFGMQSDNSNSNNNGAKSTKKRSNTKSKKK